MEKVTLFRGLRTYHEKLGDRLPPVPYFSPDCSLLLSLPCSKITVILEPSGFCQTNVAISENKAGLGSLVGVNRTVAQFYKQIARLLALHRDISGVRRRSPS
jgi:hypothetical protein